MKNHLRKSPGNVPDGHQKIEPKTARTLLVIAKEWQMSMEERLEESLLLIVLLEEFLGGSEADV